MDAPTRNLAAARGAVAVVAAHSVLFSACGRAGDGGARRTRDGRDFAARLVGDLLAGTGARRLRVALSLRCAGRRLHHVALGLAGAAQDRLEGTRVLGALAP